MRCQPFKFREWSKRNERGYGAQERGKEKKVGKETVVGMKMCLFFLFLFFIFVLFLFRCFVVLVPIWAKNTIIDYCEQGQSPWSEKRIQSQGATKLSTFFNLLNNTHTI